MKPDTRKEREIALYEAALRLIARGVNPAAMKVQQIADEAGIGKGTVYEYFASKEEILHGMALHCFDTEIARFAALREPAPPAGAGGGSACLPAGSFRQPDGNLSGDCLQCGAAKHPRGYGPAPYGAARRAAQNHCCFAAKREIDPSLPDHYCDFALLSAAAGG